MEMMTAQFHHPIPRMRSSKLPAGTGLQTPEVVTAPRKAARVAVSQKSDRTLNCRITTEFVHFIHNQR